MLSVLAVTAFGLPVAGPVPLSPKMPEVAHRALQIPAAAPAQRQVGTPGLPWTAPVLRSPMAFSMAGVAWRASLTDPLPEADIRTSRDGRTWEPWQELEISPHEGPDRRSEERHGIIASEPIWSKDARFVQVRWRGAKPPSRPFLHVVDPGPDPVQLGSPRSAAAMTQQPQIVTRAQWGANESIRRGSPSYASNVRAAFVHHTATANNYSAQDAPGLVRAMYSYHVNTNGWNDIGYNFLVDRYGRIYEGRAGGVNRAVIGAHSMGFNSGSTGVAVIGSYGSASPPSAAVNALTNLLTWKLDVHHVDPEGKVTMRSSGSNRYPEGTRVELNTISGHRDVVHTDCPGNSLYSALGGIRRNAASTGLPKIYDPAVDRFAFRPGSAGTTSSATVTARTAGAVSWAVQVLDSRNSVLRRFSGVGSNVRFTWDGRSDTGGQVGHGRYTLRIHASDGRGPARPADVGVLVADWPDGSVIRERGSGAVHLVSGSQLRTYRSAREFLSTYRWEEVADVPAGVRSAYSSGPRPGFREGSLIRTPGGGVSLITSGQRRPFRSAGDFNRMGYSWDAIVNVTWDEANAHAAGAPMNPGLRHPNGTLIRGSGPAVFLIENGLRRTIPSARIFTTHFRWNEVVNVADHQVALYPPGPSLTFRDGTLIRIDNGAAVFVVSGGRRYSISSAATFNALGYKWENVRSVSAGEAATAPAGGSI